MAKITPQSLFGIIVENDLYSCSVRLSKNGFYMAVDAKQWYSAMAEGAEAERLARHFYEQYERWENQRYEVVVGSLATPNELMGPGQYTIDTTKLPGQPTPKAAPKLINKLLLLCNQ